MDNQSTDVAKLNKHIGAVQKIQQLEYEQNETDHHSQFLTFLSGGETFAIPILNVKEILECVNITIVPMMPNYVSGVINLRGSIVPVIDLALHFGRSETQISKRTCIVIIEVESDQDEKHDIGILLDAVTEVLEIHGDNIEPTPSFGTKIRPDFIEAMGKINNKFIVILNTNRTLAIEELANISINF